MGCVFSAGWVALGKGKIGKGWKSGLDESMKSHQAKKYHECLWGEREGGTVRLTT